MLVLMLLLGVILAGLFELNKVFPNPDFTWKKFIKNNAIALTINFVVGLIFVLAKDEVNIFESTSKLFFTVVGFTGQTMFMNVADTFTKNSKTAVGINKK